MHATNKKHKIINDPIYGFIQIPYKIVYDLIQHPYFQRLRYISQLGLTHFVYPSAIHNRFTHALGAMHLVQKAVKVLRDKGVDISEEEAKGVTIAVLMHDIGHGPFSHALEYRFLKETSHEEMSLIFMQYLNKEFNGELSLAMDIFTGKYPRQFLHELVSSQLDVDRLDYLNRDSFFTGVREGMVGCDRIIHMLNVVDDQLVVEEKGLPSVEQFLIARWFMYWQVYLHPTVVCAEAMLGKLMDRVQEMSDDTGPLPAPYAMIHFWENKVSTQDIIDNPKLFGYYTEIVDTDIISCCKYWKTRAMCDTADELATRLTDRRLFQFRWIDQPLDWEWLVTMQTRAWCRYDLVTEDLAKYHVFEGTTSKSIYTLEGEQIKILQKNGEVKNILDISYYINPKMVQKPTVKHFCCYPDDLDIHL